PRSPPRSGCFEPSTEPTTAPRWITRSRRRKPDPERAISMPCCTAVPPGPSPERSEGLSSATVSLERIGHAVDMIAVDGVDPHHQQSVEDPIELGIPAEGQNFEPVKQGRVPPRPFAVMEVHGIDR